ncbi:MAG: hypothetical protein E7I26_11725 [Enterococcus faecalis]|nr:hypothetical protein [Enterococcus faecalis]
MQKICWILSVNRDGAEEVPEAAFILYNEMLAPYLPEKITKVGQPIAYVDIATKNYEQFKKALVAKSSQE